MDDKNLKWMPASEAFKRFQKDGTLPNHAAEAMATYLREGKLRARAKAIGESNEKLLVKAWKTVRLQRSYQPIPKTFWRGNRFFDEDRAHWIWAKSRFHSTLRKKPWKRRIARRVQFCVQDLASLRPQMFQEGRPKKKRGPPPDLAKRDTAWNAVLEVIAEAQIDEQVWTRKEEFTQAVHEKVTLPDGKRMVGITTVEQVCRQAFPRLAELHKRLTSTRAD